MILKILALYAVLGVLWYLKGPNGIRIASMDGTPQSLASMVVTGGLWPLLLVMHFVLPSDDD